jgi:hypothetical protein
VAAFDLDVADREDLAGLGVCVISMRPRPPAPMNPSVMRSFAPGAPA